MLVLTRCIGEEIVIAGNIRVAVVAVNGQRVRLGITAPSSVPVARLELLAGYTGELQRPGTGRSGKNQQRLRTSSEATPWEGMNHHAPKVELASSPDSFVAGPSFAGCDSESVSSRDRAAGGSGGDSDFPDAAGHNPGVYNSPSSGLNPCFPGAPIGVRKIVLMALLVLLVSLALGVALPVLALLALVVLDMASMDMTRSVCRYSLGAKLSVRSRPPLLVETGLTSEHAPGTAKCKL
jgi:carbon storage regulator